MRLYKRNYSIALRQGVSGYEEVLLYLVKKKITYLGFNIHYNDSKTSYLLIKCFKLLINIGIGEKYGKCY